MVFATRVAEGVKTTGDCPALGIDSQQLIVPILQQQAVGN